MLSFNEYMDFQSSVPLIEATARLFCELDIEPESFIEQFLGHLAEEEAYTTAGQNFRQGLNRFGGGLWNGFKNSMGGLGQMGMAGGQGARDWWKSKMDPANKITLAQNALAKLAQGSLGGYALQGGQNVNAVIAAINNHLTQLKSQLPDPVTGQPRNAGTAPAAPPTPGPSVSTPGASPTPGATGGAATNPYSSFSYTA